MKQVVQDARSGQVTLEEVPAPVLQAGAVLVCTAASVVSAGTERSILAFAEKSLLAKARARPDLVRQVWDKLRHEGLAQTYAAVTSRLDNPVPLGYSSAGTVVAVAAGAEGYRVGDRVACAGAGYAVHAELVAVPRNLCAPIPPRASGGEVPFEEAAFATLGAIALHGARLAGPSLGERVVVIGLGVVGQLATQLLVAHGCAVLGIDGNPARAALARELGAASVVVAGAGDVVGHVMAFTRDRGADAVLIAAGTDSNEPVELAGEISRRKGRVVVVGSVRMDVPRRSYYERELSLTVSCSSGPGRYDAQYEAGGVDYPAAYVRWTEQRNLEAFLDLLAAGRLDVRSLITHRLPLDAAPAAYTLLGPETREPSLGIVLTYERPEREAPVRAPVVPRRAAAVTGGRVGVAVIGAGSFARSVLLPRLRRTPGVRLRGVATASGLTAARCARRFGFEMATTDPGELLGDPDVHAVVIATPHRHHAAMAIAALKAGRHVFLEKPLCVNEEELRELTSLYASLGTEARSPILTVGFNRRFSPLAERLRAEVAGLGGIEMSYRVNAGAVPAGHWLEAPEEGGRTIGEACHFIDLAIFLTGAIPARVYADSRPGAREPSVLVVDFVDGSLLTLSYVTSGSRRLPKERLEIAAGGRSWVLEDWKMLTAFGPARVRRARGWSQAKGHTEEIARFVAAVRDGGPEPIPFAHIVAATQATFAALESARRGAPVDVVSA